MSFYASLANFRLAQEDTWLRGVKMRGTFFNAGCHVIASESHKGLLVSVKLIFETSIANTFFFSNLETSWVIAAPKYRRLAAVSMFSAALQSSYAMRKGLHADNSEN